jgi:predicted anti-sigma-YlaC factor YlaD
MSDHVSSLDLDEAAAGMAEARAQAHLAACAECRGKLDAVAVSRQAVIAAPALRQTRGRLPKVRSLRPWLWTGAAAGAAALLLVLLPLRAPRGTLAKGGAGLSLRTLAGAEATAPRIGEEVALRLSAGPHHHVLAVAIDEAGRAAPLWPAGEAGRTSGAVRPGAHLSAPMLVTAGAVRVVAAFSDESITLEEVAARRPRGDVEYLELSLRPRP